ncbi:hypothetical protein HOP50_14g73260 [Chloropicon primus]|uniref:Uncharacterized protein n=1 Tax=Chloropicon primus TaxID=1764295 RepID=A0A5B8MWH3_9CHLO|nr:hypothetical protein A3770_14p73050 [Chloropicon primus]UPR03995.1 hypothetical protein HOP50_14g73260 [Chloropicon primus]|eukprot:QDZ24787.1 hypothetical protein A3770_14p73050 [Chloropicon primus]
MPSTTVIAIVFLLTATASLSAGDRGEEGVTSVYSDGKLGEGWWDHSWGATSVDFRSTPGFEGRVTAIDADIAPWGALALARMLAGEGGAGSEDPDYVEGSDPESQELTFRIQGPLGSAPERSDVAVRSTRGGVDKWLYLTDGRVIPRVSGAFVKTMGKYARPQALNAVKLYLEDSRSKRASKEFLLSSLVPFSQQQGRLVDDGNWVRVKVELEGLLEASKMDRWNKIVLKDAGGEGFQLRIDGIALGPKSHSEADQKEGTSGEAEVYSKPSEKAVRTWLPAEHAPGGFEFARTGEGDMEDKLPSIAEHALEEFTSKKLCASYSSPVGVSHISDSGLKEPSGFAASRRYKGIIWTHQDRDTEPFLYGVIAHTGEVVSKLYVNTKKYGETDWEDIAVALCPDKSGDHCLWIADSGNVRRDRDIFYVHVLREPKLEKYGAVEDYDIWTFPYQFPKGFYPSDKGRRPWIDVESLMVSPDATKFWLVEKTVNHNGDGPVTMWETPAGSSPVELVAKDKHNILREVTKRGKDAVYDNPGLVIQMQLVNTINNPRVQQVTSFLRPEAFDPALPDWAKEKYEEGGMNWNKLRAITGMDMHPSGRALVACTYSGIWEYPLSVPFDLRHIGPAKLLSVTSKYDDAFWQTEAVTYTSEGDGIFLASEYYKGHQPIRYFGCRDAVVKHLE